MKYKYTIIVYIKFVQILKKKNEDVKMWVKWVNPIDGKELGRFMRVWSGVRVVRGRGWA